MLNQTQDHRQRVLVSVSKELQNWTIMVKKMKAIYYTLNLFNVDVTKKCLIGEGWIPASDVESVRDALAQASVSTFFLSANSSLTLLLVAYLWEFNTIVFEYNQHTRGSANIQSH